MPPGLRPRLVFSELLSMKMRKRRQHAQFLDQRALGFVDG
jgi:hypothetical protein